MKASHLEAFRPICPRCRAEGRGEHPLRLGEIARGDAADVEDGMLACPVEVCQAEYPILGGVPVIVPDPRGQIAAQIAELRARDDLSAWAESVLGDAAPPDSDFARNRLYLSSYGQAHWPSGADAPGLVPVLDAVFELGGAPRGRCVDLGCAVGRGTFELVARGADLALGVDVNLALLGAARRAMRDGRVTLPVRRVGQVFDRREVEVPAPPEARARVDFWCADATALPLAGASVDGALSLNLLDSVGWPLSHLLELARVLADDAAAVLATPYDWTASVTPIEGWLGGHSQRGPLGGSSAAELRRILARDGRPGGAPDLYLAAERDGVPWRLRLHERATMTYELHVMRLCPDRRARAGP